MNDQAARIRIRASVRLGELLGQMKATGERDKRGGDRKSKSTATTLIPKTLTDLGITRDQSHRWQLMSTVPKARAIRRAGEIFRTIKPGKTGPKQLKAGTVPQSSRAAAAKTAGISERQRKTMTAVASIPAEKFEPQHGANQNIRAGTDPKVTRKSAARAAGISERQAAPVARSRRPGRRAGNGPGSRQHRRRDENVYKTCTPRCPNWHIPAQGVGEKSALTT